MRHEGKICDWKDDRGFGFIEPAAGGGRVFVHIRSFPSTSRRPVAGDAVSYELRNDERGRMQAVHVLLAGVVPRMPIARRPPRVSRGGGRWSKGNIILIGMMILAVALAKVAGVFDGSNTHELPAPASPFMAEPATSSFTCDGRTRCSQMTSCAEATYFVQHCPNTEMDGDGDGQPCESQWCE